jgi:hypothetical protein
MVGRKAVSPSAVVARKPAHAPGHTRRYTRTDDRRRAAGRGLGAQSADKGQSAWPAGATATNIAGPKVTDDFPEFAAVLDRELDAIETYLGARLDEMLGGMD